MESLQSDEKGIPKQISLFCQTWGNSQLALYLHIFLNSFFFSWIFWWSHSREPKYNISQHLYTCRRCEGITSNLHSFWKCSNTRFLLSQGRRRCSKIKSFLFSIPLGLFSVLFLSNNWKANLKNARIVITRKIFLKARSFWVTIRNIEWWRLLLSF